MKKVFSVLFFLSFSMISFAQGTVFSMDSVNYINKTSARYNGRLVSLNSTWNTIERGFVVGRATNPTHATSSFTNNAGTSKTLGNVISNATGLAPNTTYFVRGYVIKTSQPRDTIYSAQTVRFTTLPANKGSVTMDSMVNITATTANFHATVTHKGDFLHPNKLVGFVFDTTAVPVMKTVQTPVRDSNYRLQPSYFSNAPYSFKTILPARTLLSEKQYYVRAIYITLYDTTYSNVQSFTTQAACDHPPFNFQPSNPGTTTVDLSWTGADGQRNFEIDYGPVGHPIGGGTIVSDVTSPYTLTSLTAGRQYTAYVRSKCASTTGPWSQFTSFTTKPTPCADIISVQTESLQATFAHIKWAPGNVIQNKWEVKLATQNGSYPATGSIIDTKPEVYLTGLTPQTNYKIRIRAICATENSEWTSDHIFSTTQVGLEDVKADFPLTLSPNPTTGKVFLNAGSKQITAIQVVDATGRQWSDTPLVGSEIDLSNMPEGLYFITVFAGKETATAKVLRK